MEEVAGWLVGFRAQNGARAIPGHANIFRLRHRSQNVEGPVPSPVDLPFPASTCPSLKGGRKKRGPGVGFATQPGEKSLRLCTHPTTPLSQPRPHNNSGLLIRKPVELKRRFFTQGPGTLPKPPFPVSFWIPAKVLLVSEQSYLPFGPNFYDVGEVIRLLWHRL